MEKLNTILRIDYKYRYGKTYVFADTYECDDNFVYPIENGKKLCCISRTNIISIKKVEKTR